MVTRFQVQKFKKWQFAKKQRQYPTSEEQLVWNKLRLINYQLPKGCVWRRQSVVGKYIIDFCCSRVKLGLEVDGSSHYGKEVYDKRRQFFLAQAGYEILHIKNNDVYDERLLDCFVKAIMRRTLFRLEAYNH